MGNVMWHVSHGEKQFGPFTEEKMQALIKAGKLPPTVHVWKQGMADWIMLRDSSLLQGAPPAAAPVMAAVAPAVAEANPFDFSKPAVQAQHPGAIQIATSPQPTPQQLANPYFSDFKGAPAGTPPVAAAANPNFRFLRLDGLQLFTVITTGLAAVISLVCGWLTFQQAQLIKRVATNGFSGSAMAELQASDDQFIIAFLSFVLTLLLMTIAFLMWFYRAHVNAKGMSQVRFADTSGWAVGYFFIPIMNLFKPFIGMRDIWRGSFSVPGSHAMPSSSLVTFWWIAWVAANFLSRPVMMRFNASATSIEGKLLLFYISAMGSFITAAAFVLTIVLVLKITAQQARKSMLLHQGTVPQPQPQKQFELPQF